MGLVSTEDDAIEQRLAGGGPGHEYLGITFGNHGTLRHDPSPLMVARLANAETNMKRALERYVNASAVLRSCLDEQPVDWRKVLVCLNSVQFMFVMQTDFLRMKDEVIHLHKRRVLTYGNLL